MKKGLMKKIFIWLGIISLDLIVYFILAMLLMQYDDFYDESKGTYWSLESMDLGQKINYIGLNLWHLINLIVIGYVIYRVIKTIRKNALQQVV